MSVLNEAQQSILTRLAELESGRREYDELLDAAGKLGLDYNADAAANGAGLTERAARTASRSGSSRTARSRRAQGRRRAIAPRGQRREQVLAVVMASPDGVTVKEVAEQLGLADATSLFRVQKQLVAEGAVRKDGAKMFPVATPAPS